ncbi:hypothetical protein [Bartonella tribocorum]|uniref:Uncharacterized protein n=1 Tax=Bartonella tribocorum TaxID=85701 RepID=A0A2M6UWE9_9HYPH|nr:hypothetical protein [Bartonella tribocorum]PIT70533.1 hypothetical protein CEV08_03715 [Bartonella tribocorum]
MDVEGVHARGVDVRVWIQEIVIRNATFIGKFRHQQSTAILKATKLRTTVFTTTTQVPHQQ